MPLGDLGYAQFHDGEEATPADPEDRLFELDWSVLETLSEADLTRKGRELDEALSDVRAAGLCLCQFCAPRQNLSRFDQLSLAMQQP